MQDQPTDPIGIAMLHAKDAAKRALIHKPVFWRHSSGVQFAAIIVSAWGAGIVDLLVLSNGYFDLQLPPALPAPGMPAPRNNVPFGDAHECWTWQLDT